MGFKPPQPALSTDAQAWLDDHDAYASSPGFTTSGNGDAYRAIVAAHPAIADAIGVTSLAVDIRRGATNSIWKTIDATVETGFVPTVAVPVNVRTGVQNNWSEFTRVEAINTFAAKVAHALWLEINDLVPWKLTDYDTTHLGYLLDPDNLFITNWPSWTSGWDPEGATPGSMLAVCDHDPKYVYDYFLTFMGGAPLSKKHLAGECVRWMDGHFHGPPQESKTLSEFNTTLDATGGCGPSSSFQSAVARAFNLAPRLFTGLWDGSSSHASVLFLYDNNVEGKYQNHGDDPYTATVGGMPDARLMVDWSVYRPLVIDEPDPDEAQRQSDRLFALQWPRWPTTGMLQFFTYERGNTYMGPTQGKHLIYAAFTRYAPPTLTLAEQEQAWDSLGAMALQLEPGSISEPPKIDAVQAGLYDAGLLETQQGSVTIDDAWITANNGGSRFVDHKDILGTVTLNSSLGLFLRNCRINGNGGLGISNLHTTGVTLLNCEISNCTLAIDGVAPYNVLNCHMSGNTGAPLVRCTSPNGNQTSFIRYSYFGGAAGHNVFYMDANNDLYLGCNTIVAGGTVPVIGFTGTNTGWAHIQSNWIDGGNYCLLWGDTTQGESYVSHNRFGRNATSGLQSITAGTTVNWYKNTYEDDGSTANAGDTAPL